MSWKQAYNQTARPTRKRVGRGIGSFSQDISLEVPDGKLRLGSYLSGRIGYGVHLCNKISILLGIGGNLGYPGS